MSFTDLLITFIQAQDVAITDLFEKNATTPGLANPQSLKLLPIRVSQLCKRSALLQKGNALAAMGKQEEARASYELIFPLLENEPRCARVDWERHSLHINVGNTHSRDGNFDLADEQYKTAEQLGNDHLTIEGGSKVDGNGMLIGAKRARAFALKKAGREAEGKAILKEVIEAQIKANAEAEQKKKDDEAAAIAAAEKAAEEAAAAAAAAAAETPENSE
jgi:tetratricopeptide (TPR) repeat protein